MRRDQIERLATSRHHDARRARRRARRRRAADDASRHLRGAARPGGAPARAHDRAPLYHLLAEEPQRGFALLPQPSPGDLFFDIEGDPFWEPARGLEYLFGVARREDGERASAPSGRTTATRSGGRSRSSSTSSTSGSRPTRPARLPLRALRADRAQAADGRVRHARGRDRRPAPARGVRRPLQGRPPGAARTRTRATR